MTSKLFEIAILALVIIALLNYSVGRLKDNQNEKTQIEARLDSLGYINLDTIPVGAPARQTKIMRHE